MTKKWIGEKQTPGYVWYFERMLPGDKNGAWLSSDLWYWFGTLDNCWRPMEAQDREISDQMVRYLCRFAKTGNPNHSSYLPTWLPLAKGQDHVLRLGDGKTHMGKPALGKMVLTMLTNKAVGE
jgi:para-nitrobenzyl esterase